jgi:hypothetical protein
MGRVTCCKLSGCIEFAKDELHMLISAMGDGDMDLYDTMSTW